MERASQPVRVGLLIPRGALEQWALEALDDLARTSCVILVAVIYARRRAREGGALLAAYERADRRVFRADPDGFAQREPPPWLEGLRTVEADDEDRVRRERLDVIVALADTDASETLAKCAGHGVWSVHHGSGGPPFF